MPIWNDYTKRVTKRYEWLIQQFSKALPGLYALGAERVIVFGSLVRGDFHSRSDIDIAVIINRDEYETQHMNIITHLVMYLDEENFDIVFVDPEFHPYGKNKLSKRMSQSVVKEGVDAEEFIRQTKKVLGF